MRAYVFFPVPEIQLAALLFFASSNIFADYHSYQTKWRHVASISQLLQVLQNTVHSAEVGDCSQLLACWATQNSPACSNLRGVARLILFLSYSNLKVSVVFSSVISWLRDTVFRRRVWASGMTHQKEVREFTKSQDTLCLSASLIGRCFWFL